MIGLVAGRCSGVHLASGDEALFTSGDEVGVEGRERQGYAGGPDRVRTLFFF